jgi:1-acyl-sn-glycerol-3-phosphate acyltransferase
VKKIEELQKSQDRLDILEKIKDYEKSERFSEDVENDPVSSPLLPNQVDFLNEKFLNKIKAIIAIHEAEKFYKAMLKNKSVIYKGVTGLENIQNFQGKAIITSNHCHVFDSYVVVTSLKKHFKHLKLWRTIREGNYAQPGKIGFFMRHCNSLPLCQRFDTMKLCISAIETLLKNDQKILFYPEQGMWWNYRKPRPLKNGAFKFAAKYNSPIIPFFITMQDSDIIGTDGFPVQEFTGHVLPVIYPKDELSILENAEYMKNENYRLWKELYEEVYQVKLEY